MPTQTTSTSCSSHLHCKLLLRMLLLSQAARVRAGVWVQKAALQQQEVVLVVVVCCGAAMPCRPALLAQQETAVLLLLSKVPNSRRGVSYLQHHPQLCRQQQQMHYRQTLSLQHPACVPFSPPLPAAASNTGQQEQQVLMMHVACWSPGCAAAAVRVGWQAGVRGCGLMVLRTLQMQQQQEEQEQRVLEKAAAGHRVHSAEAAHGVVGRA